MNRGLRNVLIQAAVLAVSFCLISIIWLPWYRAAFAVCATVVAAWLVVRLLDHQWKKAQQKEEVEIRRSYMEQRAKREAIQPLETTRGV